MAFPISATQPRLRYPDPIDPGCFCITKLSLNQLPGTIIGIGSNIKNALLTVLPERKAVEIQYKEGLKS